MSQANEPVTLKIHHGDDIRRFHLSQLDWSELTQLLSSHYPIPYALKYRDIDNDMVTMVAQQDLQDAMEMLQGGILHLYIFDKEVGSAPHVNDIKPTASAPDMDMKSSSSDDDITSQLSHEEISTLLQECLSDPIVITAIPPFLTTFVDQLMTNMSTATPLSTSWSQSLQQHPTIRDHVILSVLLPRFHQSLNQADNKQMATRIPSHLLPMIKGWIPMLPMFLPSIVPMITKLMSQSNTSDTQTPTNLLANSPLASMLGPMLSGLQQPTSASTSTSASASSAISATAPSPNDSSATPPNPFGLLAPLLAGAAANPSTTNNNPQTNPLLGLLGPLLAANAANTTNSANQANPFASLFQPPSYTNPNTNTNTNTNTATTTTNTIPDYTQQLNQLESMNLGSRDLNFALLKQWNGDVERVMEFLTTME